MALWALPARRRWTRLRSLALLEAIAYLDSVETISALMLGLEET